jgi:nickel-type superoxide dismutase maturation protease
MLPTFKNGDEVLIKSDKNYQLNDVVLANHPFKKSIKIIKRIGQITDDGKFFLIGDNPPESTDSRTFGFFNGDQIIGKVVNILTT